MIKNWKTYKLGEVADLATGFAFKSKFYEYKGNLKVVRGKNVTEGYLRWGNDSKFWNHSIEKLEKYNVEDGDIVIGMDGSKIGKNRALVRKHDLPSVLAQRVARVRAKQGQACQKYIWQLINNSPFENYVENVKTGTSIPHISLGQIKDFEITLPPIQEQKSIASILSALDDKIELNSQMNKTLEEMAMALYKHWFEDFGPFQSGEFVDSELGMIPKGWEVKKIGDLVTALSKGTTPRKKDVDGLDVCIPFLKVKDISNNGTIKEAGLELIPQSVHENQLKRSILQEDDILFSIAGTIGRLSIVPKKLNNANCNQALAFIRLKKENNILSQTYFYFKSPEVQSVIHSSIVQGVQANVSLTVLKELSMVLSGSATTEKFNDEVGPIFKLIQENLVEIQTLKALRDTLLPKLISGEVLVKDIEQTISKVL